MNMAQTNRNNLFNAYILGMRSNYRGIDLEKILSDYEIPFLRIDAIAPEMLPELDVQTISISNFLSITPKMSPGEICCAFGHKLIYEQITRAEFEWALVLEDDAILRIDPKQILFNSINASSPSIIQLSPDPNSLEFTTVAEAEIYTANPVIVKLQAPQLETCAYFINKSAARRILNRTPTSLISARADWPLEALNRINFFATETFCAFQIKNVKNTTIVDRNYWVKDISAPFRLLRIFARVIGLTSFVYWINGAPFKASYMIEVINPYKQKKRRG